MYNITDVLSLGTEYRIADKKTGKILPRSIQVIPHTDIIEAVGGEYNETVHNSMEEYMQAAISRLTGFDDIDPTCIMWHTTSDPDVSVVDIIEYAIKNGYDKIIVEYIASED